MEYVETIITVLMVVTAAVQISCFFTALVGFAIAFIVKLWPKRKPIQIDMSPTSMPMPCSPGCVGHKTHPCEKCGVQW